MRAIAIVALGGLLALSLAAQDGKESELEKLFGAILPKEEELAWQKIGWRSTLAEAVAEAREKDKPILLWAMNGHPLACT